MKKSAALFLVLLLTAFLAPRAEAITFGLKAGFNSSTISFNNTSSITADTNRVKGLTAGVFASFSLGLVSVQPELLYSRRGFQFYIPEGPYTYDYKLDYLEVPVLVKVRVIPAGPIKPFVFAGPSFGYLLKAKGIDRSNEPEVSYDITDIFKRTEAAVVMGAGIDLGLPFIKATLDARYHLGLTVIQESGEETSSTKNKGFSVMIGIGF